MIFSVNQTFQGILASIAQRGGSWSSTPPKFALDQKSPLRSLQRPPVGDTDPVGNHGSRKCWILNIPQPIGLHGLLRGYVYFFYFYIYLTDRDARAYFSITGLLWGRIFNLSKMFKYSLLQNFIYRTIMLQELLFIIGKRCASCRGVVNMDVDVCALEISAADGSYSFNCCNSAGRACNKTQGIL
jgi:hypothetical protein